MKDVLVSEGDRNIITLRKDLVKNGKSPKTFVEDIPFNKINDKIPINFYGGNQNLFIDAYYKWEDQEN